MTLESALVAEKSYALLLLPDFVSLRKRLLITIMGYVKTPEKS